jgi:hypothetical protein
MSADFEFVDERIHLPMGAWARTERSLLRWRGRAVLGLTAGAWRPCLFPVYSPAGFHVTSQSPADQPQHGSHWPAYPTAQSTQTPQTHPCFEAAPARRGHFHHA